MNMSQRRVLLPTAVSKMRSCSTRSAWPTCLEAYCRFQRETACPRTPAQSALPALACRYSMRLLHAQTVRIRLVLQKRPRNLPRQRLPSLDQVGCGYPRQLLFATAGPYLIGSEVSLGAAYATMFVIRATARLNPIRSTCLLTRTSPTHNSSKRHLQKLVQTSSCVAILTMDSPAH